MFRPPKRLCDRAAVVQSSVILEVHPLTAASAQVSSKLQAAAMHSVADLRDLLKVHEAYQYDPVMIGAMGGDDARLWASDCLRAAANPRGVDFDALSAQLNASDEATARELQAAGNVIVERVLERLGRMVKAEAKKLARNQSSVKIQAVFDLKPKDIKANLPWSIRALLTLDEESTVRRMVEEDLRPEAVRILTTADNRAVARLSAELGVDPSVIVDAVSVPVGVRIERAVDMYVAALSAMIISRVNRADNDSSEDEGEVPEGRTTVNSGIVKDAVAAAGGAATTPAGGVNRKDGVPLDLSGEPLRSEGFALSSIAMAALETVFANDDNPTRFVVEYTWHHNSTGSDVRSDHLALDNVSWRTPAERFERIGKNSTSQNGCNCTVSSRLIPVPLDV